MAIRSGSYIWTNSAADIYEFQTRLNGLMNAIAAASTSWSVYKAATLYKTDGAVYGVIEHTGGVQVSFCMSTVGSPLVSANLVDGDASTYRRLYACICPATGVGFTDPTRTPLGSLYCSEAGALRFMLIPYYEMQGADRAFRFRCDDDAGWLLFSYERTVGTPYCFHILSGNGDDSVYDPASVQAGEELTNEFARSWKAGYMGWDPTYNRNGIARRKNGDLIENEPDNAITLSINTTSMNSTYNPSEPWVYAGISVLTAGDGLRGIIDRDLLGYIRSGAVSNKTALEGGTFQHLTDGLVWVDP